MTIELENGKLDQIIIHENQSPQLLAKQFCEKHSLRPTLRQALATHIERNIEQIMEQGEAPDFEITEGPQIETRPRQIPVSNFRSYIEEYAKSIMSKGSVPIHQDRTQSRLSYQSLSKRTSATPGLLRPRTISPVQKMMRHGSKPRCRSPFKPATKSARPASKSVARPTPTPGKKKKPATPDETAVFEQIEASIQFTEESKVESQNSIQLSSIAPPRQKQQSATVNTSLCNVDDDVKPAPLPVLDQDDEAFIASLINSRKQTETYLRRSLHTTGASPTRTQKKPRAISSSKSSQQRPQLSTSAKPAPITRNASANALTRSRDTPQFKLFRLLNPDSQGFISSNRINVNVIDKDVLDIISPILVDMENQSLHLDFAGFEERYKQRLTELHPEELRVILNRKKLEPVRGGSKPIRRLMRRSTSTSAVVNRLMQRHKAKEEKLKQKQVEQVAKEMEGCTFKPKINRETPSSYMRESSVFYVRSPMYQNESYLNISA